MNTTFENKDNNFNRTQTNAILGTVGNRLSNQIESVKRQVFHEFQTALAANQHLLRLALFEADVLARQTGYPELLFPMLAAEKAQSSARWQHRQQYILRNNASFALAA